MDNDQAESHNDSLVAKVTRAINGSANGLAQRQLMTKNAKRVLNDKAQ